MDCTTCRWPPERRDRPHTFFAHEMSRCDGCGESIEARIVLRDGAVFALKHCSRCGPSEERVADDGERYVQAFLARGVAAGGQGDEHLFKHTTSTCPSCLSLIDARVVIREDRVYFDKACPDCGPSRALVSESAQHYVGAYAFAQAGTEPLRFAARVDRGCPDDCGTCADHEQHTCLPIIEVTDHCNLECPICLVDNRSSNHITLEQFRAMIDRLVRAEGVIEAVALSGGEPTSHPQFFDLLEIANRDEIGRVSVLTNGLRLGRDLGFARRFKAADAYCVLQLDGFTPEAHATIRGRDLSEEKAKALAALKEHQIPTQIIFVAARGVNEDQIGRAVDLLLSERHIQSLVFQPASFSGAGGGRFPHDPLDRITIPGVLRRIEEQTGGQLRESDFRPLPCSHPNCVSLTYLLRLDDGGFLPWARFADLTEHMSLLRSSATPGASEEFHEVLKDVIFDAWSRQDEIERGPEVVAALRRGLDLMFPGRALSTKDAIRIGEYESKSIFVRHYMDSHDFDLERLRKCCHHYPQIDGRIMPACGFNLFHRGSAKGPGTPIAPWGKNPWVAGASKPSSQTGAAGVRRLPTAR